ncbi:MAG: sigma-70 family RNA polymerase sigma factor [bacterium]|nr:sigma-70 family RNA polymerase sigma factor [bacterium]
MPHHNDLSELLVHKRYLESLALALAGDEEAAADVVQETWLAAIEHPPRDRSNLRSWLRTVARNVVFRDHKRRRLEQVDVDALERASQPDAPVEHQRVLASLRATVLELEEPYGSVVRMRHLERKTPAQIASELGRSVNTVNSQLQRGLKRLRERLDRQHDGDRSAWTSAILLVPHESRLRSPAVASWLFAIAAVVVLVPTGIAVAKLVGRDWRSSEPLAQAEPTVTPEPNVLEDARPRGPERIEAGQAIESTAAAAPVAARETTATVEPVGWIDLEVVDAADDPVPGSTVAIRFGEGWVDAGQTDATGSLSLPVAAGHSVVLSPGRNRTSYTGLHVRRKGFTDPGIYMVRFPRGTRAEVRVRLDGPPRAVRGQVTDSEGRPIPRAAVYAGSTAYATIAKGSTTVRSGARPVLTDRDGEFENTYVHAERRYVDVSAHGFLNRRVPIEVGSDGEIPRVVLHRGGTVAGRVTAEDSAPVPGATVLVEVGRAEVDQILLRTRTDAEGRYRITGVPKGVGWLTATKHVRPTYYALESRSFEAREDVEWSPVLTPRPGLHVCVRNPDETPYVGAYVSVQSDDEESPWVRNGKSRPDGGVSMWYCPDRKFGIAIYASEEDYFSDATPLLTQVGLKPIEDSCYTFVIRPKEVGAIEGRILDPDGRPLSDARLYLSDGYVKLHYPIDPQAGTYRAEGLTPGTYDVTVWSPRFGISIQDDVAIEANETRHHDIDVGSLADTHVEWSLPADESLCTYTLLARDPRVGRKPDTPRDYLVQAGSAPPPAVLQLFPGTYVLRVALEGAPVREHAFVVQGGGITKTVVGGD